MASMVDKNGISIVEQDPPKVCYQCFHRQKESQMPPDSQERCVNQQVCDTGPFLNLYISAGICSI